MVLALAATSFAQPNIGLVYHEVEVVDEEGVRVTDISSVDLYNVGTTTSSTIYKERGAVGAIELPMTSATTNTTLSSGFFYWWGPAGYDFSITDGTNTHTNYGFRARTASEGRISFPSYLHGASTTSWTDDQSITMGTSPDWVINAGTTANLITFTPVSDGAVFRVGEADGNPCADLQWYTASGVGLIISESSNTFGITGLTANINVSSNYATNINTGTSTGDVHILDGTGTGAIDIGNSASGVVTIDGASTMTINCDLAMSITTTTAAADITIDAEGGRLLLLGGEDAANAIIFTVDGGTASTIEIFNDTGNASTKGAASIQLLSDLGAINLHAGSNTSTTEMASAIQLTARLGSIELNSGLNAGDAIHLIVDSSTSAGITIFNDTGIGDESIYVLTDAGGITLKATDGSIDIEPTGGANGDLGITVGDDMTTTVAGDYSITTTGALAITGGSTTFDEIYFLRKVVTNAGTITLASANSGGVFFNTADTYQAYILPTAVVGLQFTFCDQSHASGDRIKITAGASDSIDGGTAAKSILSPASGRASITLVCGSITNWQIMAGSGNWPHTSD